MDTPGTPAKSSSRTWVYFLIGALVVIGIALVVINQTGSQQSGRAGRRPVASCTDSDGGQVTTVAGTVTAGVRSAADTCVDATRVREAFCLKGKLKSSTLSCESGYQCLDGACVQYYTLTINNNPSILRVTSNDSIFVSSEVGYRPRIDCGEDCSESYPAGTVVILGVGLADGVDESRYAFSGYTGDYDGESDSLTMDSDKTVGFTYREISPSTSEPPPAPTEPPSQCSADQYTCGPFSLCEGVTQSVQRTCTVNVGVSCTIPDSATIMGCTSPPPSESPAEPQPTQPPAGSQPPPPPTTLCSEAQYFCPPFPVCAFGELSVRRICTVNAGVSCTIPATATIIGCTIPAGDTPPPAPTTMPSETASPAPQGEPTGPVPTQPPSGGSGGTTSGEPSISVTESTPSVLTRSIVQLIQRVATFNITARGSRNVFITGINLTCNGTGASNTELADNEMQIEAGFTVDVSPENSTPCTGEGRSIIFDGGPQEIPTGETRTFFINFDTTAQTDQWSRGENLVFHLNRVDWHWTPVGGSPVMRTDIENAYPVVGPTLTF